MASLLKKVKKAEKYEEKEEKWLLREYSYLDKLRKDIEKKDKKAADRIARRMGRYEPRLERLHKRILQYLELLKKEGFVGDAAKELDNIEEEINVFRADVVKEISRYTGELRKLIKEEKWKELEDNVIKRLEKDIQGWIILIKKLIKFEKEESLKSLKEFIKIAEEERARLRGKWPWGSRSDLHINEKAGVAIIGIRISVAGQGQHSIYVLKRGEKKAVMVIDKTFRSGGMMWPTGISKDGKKFYYIIAEDTGSLHNYTHRI